MEWHINSCAWWKSVEALWCGRASADLAASAHPFSSLDLPKKIWSRQSMRTWQSSNHFLLWFTLVSFAHLCTSSRNGKAPLKKVWVWEGKCSDAETLQQSNSWWHWNSIFKKKTPQGNIMAKMQRTPKNNPAFIIFFTTVPGNIVVFTTLFVVYMIVLLIVRDQITSKRQVIWQVMDSKQIMCCWVNSTTEFGTQKVPFAEAQWIFISMVQFQQKHQDIYIYYSWERAEAHMLDDHMIYTAVVSASLDLDMQGTILLSWHSKASMSYMDVSKNRGTPKWMMNIMETPMNKWMIWGSP